MAAMRALFRLLLLLACAAALPADVSRCACDPARPETLKERNCSLCAEAEKQPAGVRYFVLKDANPRKPNRWLALPRRHLPGPHHLHDLPKPERDELWRFAVKTAREKFGEEWGIAYNGAEVRTQCHLSGGSRGPRRRRNSCWCGASRTSPPRRTAACGCIPYLADSTSTQGSRSRKPCSCGSGLRAMLT
jgi:diadenosine tetraphosphate (Ap4A) HIT family hydrolase